MSPIAQGQWFDVLKAAPMPLGRLHSHFSTGGVGAGYQAIMLQRSLARQMTHLLLSSR